MTLSLFSLDTGLYAEILTAFHYHHLADFLAPQPFASSA